MASASYFGLGLDYNDDWVGRYYVTKAELLTFGVTPTVACRANDWLSTGAGPTFVSGSLEQKAVINNAFAEGDPAFQTAALMLKTTILALEAFLVFWLSHGKARGSASLISLRWSLNSKTWQN